MKTKCKGIIFDFDGTLVHLDVNWRLMRERLGELFQQYGLVLDTSSVLGSIQKAFDTLSQDPKRKGLANKFRYQAEEIITKEEITGLEKAILLPGAREILDLLTVLKIPVVILSNNVSCCARIAFAKFGLPSPAAIVGREMVYYPKPAIEGAQLCLDIMGIKSNECWLIGDSSPDVELGTTMGFNTIFICSTTTKSQAKSETLVISNLLQLRPMLQE
jgi:beta-phosphoglucomutase-like phosphatase (HAD superfamily)